MHDSAASDRAVLLWCAELADIFRAVHFARQDTSREYMYNLTLATYGIVSAHTLKKII